MKGVFSWWARWACRVGTRDFLSALAAQVGPVQNIIFPHCTAYTISIPLSPSPSKPGRQLCWVARLLVYCVSGRDRQGSFLTYKPKHPVSGHLTFSQRGWANPAGFSATIRGFFRSPFSSDSVDQHLIRGQISSERSIS
jgi:hypothetical protein